MHDAFRLELELLVAELHFAVERGSEEGLLRIGELVDGLERGILVTRRVVRDLPVRRIQRQLEAVGYAVFDLMAEIEAVFVVRSGLPSDPVFQLDLALFGDLGLVDISEARPASDTSQKVVKKAAATTAGIFEETFIVLGMRCDPRKPRLHVEPEFDDVAVLNDNARGHR